MEKLGERIYEYRTAKGLSQLDLAEHLDVSRQSISKWETNVAVPELSKLVKMAELFGVTLDELILDKKTEIPTEDEILMRETVRETVAEIKREERRPSLLKTVFGVIFLVVGILFAGYCLLFGAWLTALAFLTPCVLSAVFCLKQFRFAALWCVETWFGFAAMICYNSMSISWSQIWMTSFLLLQDGANPMRVALAWVLAITLALLIGITVWVYRRHDFAFSKKKRIVFCVGTIAVFPLKALVALIIRRIMLAVLGVQGMSQFMISDLGRVYHCASYFAELAWIAAFTVFLVPTFYFLLDIIKEKRNANKK